MTSTIRLVNHSQQCLHLFRPKVHHQVEVSFLFHSKVEVLDQSAREKAAMSTVTADAVVAEEVELVAADYLVVEEDVG